MSRIGLTVRGRRAFSSIYVCVLLVALSGMVSLGVDLGRVQLARSQLQTAADAAARAAANGFATSVAQARSSALAVASANTCDGAAINLNSTQDVEFGTWNAGAGTFTPLGSGSESSATAVRVTARRTVARGNPISLVFARLVGKQTADVSASCIMSVATTSSGFGLFGVTSVTMSGSADIKSWSSSSGGVGSSAYVGSNGNITLSGSAKVWGDAHPGPGKSVTTSGASSVTGSKSPLPATESYPVIAAGAYASSNNNSVLPAQYFSGGNFTINANKSYTFPPGVYYIRNLTVSGSADISTSGAVTIYLYGALSISGNGDVTTYHNKPANLRINVTNSSGVNVSGSGLLYADVYAPQSPVSISGSGDLYGRVIANTLTISGSGILFHDTTLGGSGGGGSSAITLLK